MFSKSIILPSGEHERVKLRGESRAATMNALESVVCNPSDLIVWSLCLTRPWESASCLRSSAIDFSRVAIFSSDVDE